MDNLLRTAIEHEVDKQLEGQKDKLKECIFRGCDKADSWEVICAKMVLNGISVGTKLAAEMAIDILIKSGVRNPKSDDELRRELFSVVQQEDGRMSE